MHRFHGVIYLHDCVVIWQYCPITAINFVKCAPAIALESGGKRQVRDREIQKFTLCKNIYVRITYECNGKDVKSSGSICGIM